MQRYIGAKATWISQGKPIKKLHLCRKSSAALRLSRPSFWHGMAMTHPVILQPMTMV